MAHGELVNRGPALRREEARLVQRSDTNAGSSADLTPPRCDRKLRLTSDANGAISS